MARMISIQVRFPEEELKRIDGHVENGEFSSRSDLIRDAVRKIETIRSMDRIAVILEAKGITFNDLLEGTSKIREDLFKEMFGEYA